MEILSKNIVEDKISKSLPKDLLVLEELFHEFGFKLFLVGGFIRDMFMGKDGKDFDVCTDALPNDIINILKSSNVEFEERGKSHGVIVAKMSEEIEIATFRTDMPNENGVSKDIEVKFGCSDIEDVERRDLTINGLLFDISESKVIDHVNAINDLENGIIRTIGDSNIRFREDQLRKLRCIRFSTRLGFDIEEHTLNSIKENPSLEGVANERIFEELLNSFNRCISIDDLSNKLIKSNLSAEIFNSSNLLIKREISENISFGEFVFNFIFDKEVDEIRKILLEDNSMPTKVVNTCIFLKELKVKLDNLEVINPLWFKRGIKKTDMAEVNLIKSNSIEFLNKFNLNSEITKSLIKKGIKGSDLGDKLNEIVEKMYIREVGLDKLDTFEKLLFNLPIEFRERINKMKLLKERDDFHPEESTFEHIRIVTERALRIGDKDLIASAILHDIHKIDCATINDKTGFVTCPEHDKMIEGTISNNLDIQEFILKIGADLLNVKFICGEHMRISNINSMSRRKVDKYRSHPTFLKLLIFHKIDDMLISEDDLNNLFKSLSIDFIR